MVGGPFQSNVGGIKIFWVESMDLIFYLINSITDLSQAKDLEN